MELAFPKPMSFKEMIATLQFQTHSINVEDFLLLTHESSDTLDLIWKKVEPGALQDFLKENPRWWKVSEEIIKQARGLQIVYPGHKDYPHALLEYSKPPLFLSFLGNPIWNFKSILSLVGSREPSQWSLLWLEQNLGYFLKESQWIILSGAARGIDQKSHAISLRVNSPTIAILPSGIYATYPKDFVKWYDSIISGGGAILSEYQPYSEMRKHYFIQRNRLIAWLGDLLFVAEAQKASGSLLTARLALEAGKILSVLPGFPSDGRCAGTVDLLFDGAQPIRDAKDLIALCSIHSHRC